MHKQILVAVLLFLVACSPGSQLEPLDATKERAGSEQEVAQARPDIPRTYDGEGIPQETTEETQSNRSFLTPIVPSQGISPTSPVAKGTAVHLNIPLGFSFSEVYPGVGREILPLLRPQAVRGILGNTQSYEQYFTFDGGNVTFVRDESREDDYLGTVLEFDAGHNYMNYTFVMKGRPFYDHTIIGSDVVLLGGTYKILEATNFTVQLAGVDVEQYLDIENGSRLKTNKKTIADTYIHYNGFAFTIEFHAPDIDGDTFWLYEGQTLRERFEEDRELEALLGSTFNLRYDGLEELDVRIPQLALTFDVHDEYVDLEWGEADTRVRLPLLGLNSSGDVWMGNEKKTHYNECASINDGCIAIGDVVVVSGVIIAENGERIQTTRLLELGGIDAEEEKIVFRDVATRARVSVDYEGTFNGRQSTRLPLFTSKYPIYVFNTTVNGESQPTHLAMGLRWRSRNSCS